MTATVRHFNGTNTDYIATLAGGSAYDVLSGAGWINQDALGTDRAMCGRVVNASTNSWMFRMGTTGLLVLNVNNGASANTVWSDSIPNFVGSWGFVGFSFNKATGLVKFYSGTNAGNLALLGTVNGLITWQIPNAGGAATQIGGATQANLAAIGWFNGFMDQWAIWNRELAIADFRNAMVCGAEVYPADAIVILPIVGTNPEPVKSLGGNDTLTVNGTTVTTGAGIGCELALTGIFGARLDRMIPTVGLGVRSEVFNKAASGSSDPFALPYGASELALIPNHVGTMTALTVDLEVSLDAGASVPAWVKAVTGKDVKSAVAIVDVKGLGGMQARLTSTSFTLGTAPAGVIDAQVSKCCG